MVKNVGTIDRSLRVVFGVVLVALAFVGPKTPWGFLGVIPILTGLFSYCPVYTPLKINTGAKKSDA